MNTKNPATFANRYVVRAAGERGHLNYGWLDTWHTFSFGRYYDPKFVGFGPLRVINEDYVSAGRGFGRHGHENMEIITYVLSGALEHTDSLGHRGVIRPGEVQVMTAGRGIEHSEANPSDAETVHLLQIWIEPEALNLEPRYEQQAFAASERQDRWQLVASGDGRQQSLRINQQADLYLAELSPGTRLARELASNRRGWLQVARGRLRVGELQLSAGDGLAATGGSTVELIAEEAAEVLWFDLP